MAISASLNAIRFGVKLTDLTLRGNVSTYTGLPNYIDGTTRETCNIRGETFTSNNPRFSLIDNDNNIYVFNSEYIQRISYTTNEVKIIAGKKGATGNYTVGPALDSNLAFLGPPAIDSNKNIYIITNNYKGIIKLVYDTNTDSYTIEEYAGLKSDTTYVTGTSFLSSGSMEGLICDSINPSILYILSRPVYLGARYTHDIYKLTFGAFSNQRILNSTYSSDSTAQFNLGGFTIDKVLNKLYIVYNYYSSSTFDQNILYSITDVNVIASPTVPNFTTRILQSRTSQYYTRLTIDQNSFLYSYSYTGSTTNGVYKISLSTYTITKIAGGGVTQSDGLANSSMIGNGIGINSVLGCVSDTDSNIYILEQTLNAPSNKSSYIIRKISQDGYINWYAGSGDIYNAPLVSNNRFRDIRFCTVDQNNNLFISDTNNMRIISNDVTNGTKFSNSIYTRTGNFNILINGLLASPFMCIDENGFIYKSSTSGIIKYDRFNNITSMLNTQNFESTNSCLVYYNGFIYATSGTLTYAIIRTNISNGTFSTVYTDTAAGSIIILGIKGSNIYYTDNSRTVLYRTTIGVWTKVTLKTGLSRITALTTDNLGNIYIADCKITTPPSSIIKKLDPTNTLTNLVGTLTGYTDGASNVAQFGNITSIVYNNNNYKLYVAENGNIINSNVPVGQLYENRAVNYYTVIRVVS